MFSRTYTRVSSRQAIKKYVRANNTLGDISDNTFNTRINKAIENGEKSGDFERPKGKSGPVKLAKKGGSTSTTAAAKPKTATKAKTAPAKKATTTKRAAAPKKATATKTKANVGKKAAPKKPAAAPAVTDTKPTVLGKTKSGRVTKSKAPQPAKKATPKKAAAKKATPKKSATKA